MNNVVKKLSTLVIAASVLSLTGHLAAQQRDPGAQITAITAEVHAHSYSAAGVLIGAAENGARALAGSELSAERFRAAVRTPAGEAVVLALLQQALASAQNKDLEGELFSLTAAGYSLAKLDSKVPPQERFLRDSAIADSKGTPGWLHTAALAALNAGMPAETIQYARREMALFPSAYPPSTIPFMLHRTHTLIGLADLKANDFEGAIASLMDSLKDCTAGTFGNSGPSMALVKQLLIKNQIEPVVQYLTRCEEIGVPRGQQQLAAWKALAQAGQIPDFRAAAMLY